MKNVSILILLILASFGCNQNNNLLDTQAFSEGIKQPNVLILDVRTPAEFSKERIANAINYDIYAEDFSKQVAGLDKTKDVYVYCLAGSRSNTAADILKENGFKNVYELKGGLLAWLKQNNPVETTMPMDENVLKQDSNPSVAAQYQKAISSSKLTMVDFFTYWCGPCMKMKPSIDKLSKELASDVTILSINAEEEINMAKDAKVEAYPTLAFFKNGQEIYRHIGGLDESGLRKLIAKYK